MNINKTRIAMSGLAVLALLSACPAYAGFSEGSNVTMGGSTVLTFLASAEGYTPAHRAWMTQDALDNALVLAHDRSPNAVTVSRMNNAIVVLLDGRLVATADEKTAELLNLTPEALAGRWAESIKMFLSNAEGTDAYLATLTGQNPVKAELALIERRLYAPAGLEFAVNLSKDINWTTAKAGDLIEATIANDVQLGHFVIPGKSILLGKLVETSTAGEYSVAFTTLRTLAGTELPINAVLGTSYIASIGPHAVCTYAIPSGMANGMPDVVGRVPASIGIGTKSGPGTTTLVLSQSNGFIAAAQPVTVILERNASVAVISRHSMM